MRLLVTGGAGFIGSNLIRHIIDRAPVDLLVNLDCLTYAGNLASLENVVKHPKYVFEQVDLRQKHSVIRVVEDYSITHVLHLAAESHVDRSISGPDDCIYTNVVGTFHLLESCRQLWDGKFEGKRFHHVSTDEVYGSLGETGAFRETTPYAPNSPYSASKASADMLTRAYHHTYGLPIVITNCSNNYGPYQFPEKLIPVAIQSILSSNHIPIYGDGSNVRDWLYVRDHAEALWQALTNAKVGKTYNIGGGNQCTNLDIVSRICDLCDEFIGNAQGTSRNLITFVTDRPGHDWRYAIDASKIEAELGWRPKYSFERGLRETVQWYLDHQSWVREVQQERMHQKR